MTSPPSSALFTRPSFSLISCRSRSRVSSVNLSSLSLSDESLSSSCSRSNPRDDRNHNNSEDDLVHHNVADDVDCGTCTDAPDSPTPSVCVTEVSSSSCSNGSGADMAPSLPSSLLRRGWGSAQTRKAYGDLSSLSAGMPLKKRARLTPSSSLTSSDEWGYFVDTAM